jgi:hypothetical protein
MMQPRAFISIWALIQPASWSSQGKPRNMGTRSLNFFGVLRQAFLVLWGQRS